MGIPAKYHHHHQQQQLGAAANINSLWWGSCGVGHHSRCCAVLVVVLVSELGPARGHQLFGCRAAAEWCDVELQACLKQTLGAGPPGQSATLTQLGPCGLMDKAPDFGSGDCRFESCHGRTFYHFQFIMELLASVTSQRICNVILGDLRAMIPYDSTQYTTHKPRVLLRNRFKLFIQLYASLELSTLLVPC